MSLQNPDVIGAAGSVGADGVAVWAAGFASATTGAGVYTITLDEALDATECAVLVTPRTTAQLTVAVVHTSDTVKTINFLLVASATNGAFDVLVIKKPHGT